MTLQKNPDSTNPSSVPKTSNPAPATAPNAKGPAKSMQKDVASGENDDIMKYVTVLGGAALVIVVALGGYFLYDYFASEKREKALARIYQFEKGPLSNFQEKKASLDDLLKEWESLQKEVDHKRLASVAMQISEILTQEKKGAESVVQVLAPQYEKFKSDPYLSYFLVLRLSAAYEDLGKWDEAIKLLEGITQKESNFLPAKTYFDLGRLYQKKGDKEKAKVNLQYVVDNYPDDRLAHISRLYLKKL